MKKTKQEFNIKDILSIFIPTIWIIVLVAIVFASLTAGYLTLFKDDTFSSSVTMYVANEANATLNTGVIDVSTAMVERCGVAILSKSFLQDVIGYIESDEDYLEHESEWKRYMTVNYLKGVIKIKQLKDTEYFDITVTTHDKKLSYVIVSAVDTAVQNRLTEYLPYDSKYIRTRTINSAVPAINPDSKHTLRWTAVAFFAGAVLSMLVIFVYSQFDVTIRDKKKLEDAFDIPVVGVIPRFITEEGKK